MPLISAFQLTTVLAVVEDAGGTAAPGEEGQRRRHQPVHDAALPRSQSGTASCGDEEETSKRVAYLKQIRQTSIELPLVDLMLAPLFPSFHSKRLLPNFRL